MNVVAKKMKTDRKISAVRTYSPVDQVAIDMRLEVVNGVYAAETRCPSPWERGGSVTDVCCVGMC